MTPFQKKLLFWLFIMALLSPLGIILPEKFNAGDAWGEWGAETIERLLGYVPEGLRKYIDLWKAPIADYSFGGEKATLTTQVISYIVSGVIGVLLVGLTVYVIVRFLKRHER